MPKKGLRKQWSSHAMKHLSKDKKTNPSDSKDQQPEPGFLLIRHGKSGFIYADGSVFFPVFFLLVFFASSTLSAQDRPKIYQTQYATIAYGNERDFYAFTKNIGSGLSFISESPERNPFLARNRVDKIVEMTRSLLDMHPLNLRFTIALYRTRSELNASYRALGMGGAPPPAYYYHRTRTIAISIEEVSDRILAHEIAHAIICTYFGLPPPARMQEILAQHVDKYLWNDPEGIGIPGSAVALK